MKTLAAVLCLASLSASAGIAACSSSSSSSAPSGDAGADATADAGFDGVDPMNCVPPGTKGNDQGIGGYCSPGGNECTMAGPDASLRICSADVPDAAPPHAWFCTYGCMHSSECGMGAVCVKAALGNGCIPASCVYLEGDAATPIGDDGGGD